MAGLAAFCCPANPFAERIFERHLEPCELFDAVETAESTWTIPAHVLMPVGAPGLIGGGEFTQHVDANLQ